MIGPSFLPSTDAPPAPVEGHGNTVLSRRAFGKAAMGAAFALSMERGAFGAQGRHRDGPLLFAYFGTGAGESSGLKLALSDDGTTFRELADGRSFLRPMVGEAKLMRDPFVFRGEGGDGRYHMVWTTAWEGRTIGHATSTDLRHWSPQRALPVMDGIAGVRNCWAPEVVWDPARRHYVVFWSSTVDGLFPETARIQGPKNNHRLWYVTTRDFNTFTAPRILFDPGFSVIDGTFVRDHRGWLMLLFKDETQNPARKWLQLARAATPTGPFGPPSAAFTPSWVEGPMTARIDDRTICYYDVYTAGRWGAVETRDFVSWRDVSAELRMPRGARHGSLLRVSRALADGLAAGPVPS